MKHTVAAFALMMLSTGLICAGDGEGTDYGQGVTLQEVVSISQLLADPDIYLGQNVRVDGVITAVCKKRGCWMQVTDPDSGEGIRFKVDDGVIVIPYTAMGQRTSAEGVFDAIQLTPEQAAVRRAGEGHPVHTHAPGETCDRGVAGKTGCDAPVRDDKIYLIRGTGAIIYS